MFGPVDVGFLQDMAVHHDQAVVMADIVKDNPSPAVRALANQILQSQLVEIGEMRGWLLMWGQPTLPMGKPMTWMSPVANKAGETMPMPEQGGGMPGMASTVELNQLRAAHGSAQEVLFLQLMLRHHLSAVLMARYAAQHATNRLVAQTATMMLREQSEEAVAMQTMLQEAGVKPLPFPAVALELRP